MKPLYDRLELKLVTEYVQDRSARLKILRDKQSTGSGAVGAGISLDELCAMQNEAAMVAVPEAVNELMDDILCELREKGVHISDRKYFGYHHIAQAYAWLQGRSEVQSPDLLILRHYLWTSLSERTVINEVLERKCVNPLKDSLDNIHAMALESFKDFEESDSLNVKRIGKLRNEFVELYRSLNDLKSKAQGTEIQQIEDAISVLEEISGRAHAATSYTNVPLSELFSISQIA